MLHELLNLAANPTAESYLRRRIAECVQSLLATTNLGDRSQVASAEAAIRADPKTAFTFDPQGRATLTVAGNRWQAGYFETPSIAELRQRAEKVKGTQPGTTAPLGRFWVLDGASPMTDIGSLQARADRGTLFQVASQFNCLESPGPYVTSVSRYFFDPTQGPRASISAFPATLLRHYAAPTLGGERFVQVSDGQQIDLLADVFGPENSPVRNGYLTDHGGKGAAALVAALETHFDQIRVGVHDAAQVVLGYRWDGAVFGSATRQITQVFTSTVAGGGYGGEAMLRSEFVPACRHLLRAAYLGTLLAALALGRTTVVLTLVGGGVFGNPIEVIWDSILWAVDEVQPLLADSFDVVINGYGLSRQIDIEQILPDVRARGGVLLQFSGETLAEIHR